MTSVGLTAFGGEHLRDQEQHPWLSRLARLLGLYVIAICLINLGSVVLQCGAEACHTSGYKLLGGA